MRGVLCLLLLLSVAEAAAAQAGPWTRALRVEGGAFPPVRGAPTAVVHAPPSFDGVGPLRVVVFLHGWNGCARVLVEAGPVPCREGARPRDGWDLAGRVDEAGRDVLLVVPQLSFLARSGDPGAFRERGRFRAFLRAALAAVLDAPLPERLPPIVLAAHSAGYEAALEVVLRGEVAVSDLVLFDALYRGVDPFHGWVVAAPGRRLVSLDRDRGRPGRNGRRLVALARRALGDEAVAEAPADRALRPAWDHRVAVLHTRVAHGAIPGRFLAAVLALPPLGVDSRRGE